MLNGGDQRFRDTITSAIGWWIDAGLDMSVEEAPRDWLTAPARPMPVAERPAAQASGEAPFAPQPTPIERPRVQIQPLPADLPALHALLVSGAYIPNAPPERLRVAAGGDPASDLMIIADMPEQGDEEAGHLFSGETARLFDAMLAAMGQTRGSIYYAPLSPARMPGGRIDAEAGATLGHLMRHHIALARPKALILFGDETARLLIGEEALAKRGGLRALNHDGLTVPAIAVAHPRLLRQYPARKAATWADMRLILGVLAR